MNNPFLPDDGGAIIGIEICEAEGYEACGDEAKGADVAGADAAALIGRCGGDDNWAEAESDPVPVGIEEMGGACGNEAGGGLTTGALILGLPMPVNVAGAPAAGVGDF